MEKYIRPTEAVTVDFGDGEDRELRYNLATCQRLRKRFGLSVMNGEMLRDLDEDKLPELLFEGLVNKKGITAAAIAEMTHPGAVPYLINQFVGAFTGAFPKSDPNAESSQPTAT